MARLMELLGTLIDTMFGLWLIAVGGITLLMAPVLLWRDISFGHVAGALFLAASGVYTFELGRMIIHPRPLEAEPFSWLGPLSPQRWWPLRASVLTWPRFELNTGGISRIEDDGTPYDLSWSQLERVLVVTTPWGPWREDLYMVLLDKATRQPMVVPNCWASELGLVSALGELRPGLDFMTMIAMTGSTDWALAEVWPQADGALVEIAEPDWQVILDELDRLSRCQVPEADASASR